MNHQPWMTQEQWLEFGIAQGYCSDIACIMHDGVPMSKKQAAELDDGGDPCIYGVGIAVVQ